MRWRGAEASNRLVLALAGVVVVVTLASDAIWPADERVSERGPVAAQRPEQPERPEPQLRPTPQPGAWAGVSAGSMILQEDAAALRRHLDGIAATGARWLRVDLYWGVIEPSPGDFDWSAPDAVIDGARARGMSVIAVAGYAPAWARPPQTSDKRPPDDPAAFGRFVAEAAARYGPDRVRVWEIWNEPNVVAFWEPAPDPVAYTTLLQAGAAAIRSVDPTATILLGGLAPSEDEPGSGFEPTTFLAAVYGAGGGDAFDGVAVHPYAWPSGPVDPETSDWNAFQAVPALYEVMRLNGDGAKRIWGTEFGAPTGEHERAVAEEDQLRFLEEAYPVWLSWPWTGPLLVYQYRDAGTDPGDPEDNFGLVRRDFTPKAAGRGFGDVVAATICRGRDGGGGCRPTPGLEPAGVR